jgi:CBS domain-containing protein
MLLHGFRHLPVSDGRLVVGVVSLRDLAAARIRRPISPG